MAPSCLALLLEMLITKRTRNCGLEAMLLLKNYVQILLHALRSPNCTNHPLLSRLLLPPLLLPLARVTHLFHSHPAPRAAHQNHRIARLAPVLPLPTSSPLPNALALTRHALKQRRGLLKPPRSLNDELRLPLPLVTLLISRVLHFLALHRQALRVAYLVNPLIQARIKIQNW